MNEPNEEAELVLEVVWPGPGGDPLEHLRGPFTGLLGPLGLVADDEPQQREEEP